MQLDKFRSDKIRGDKIGGNEIGSDIASSAQLRGMSGDNCMGSGIGLGCGVVCELASWILKGVVHGMSA